MVKINNYNYDDNDYIDLKKALKLEGLIATVSKFPSIESITVQEYLEMRDKLSKQITSMKLFKVDDNLIDLRPNHNIWQIGLDGGVIIDIDNDTVEIFRGETTANTIIMERR